MPPEPSETATASRPKRVRAVRGLPVYICEYHHEALRCLHHAIRRRRLAFEGVTMVHLDAHPDLSASTTMPAEIIFDSPHELYHHMRTDPGGIAQWILPAVYGGHIRCVWWVRPSWAHQIANGDYSVAVGRCQQQLATCQENGSNTQFLHRRREAQQFVESVPDTRNPPTGQQQEQQLQQHGSVAANGSLLETVRISCAEPYFVEDSIYCPESDLVSAKPLRLFVSELPNWNDADNGGSEKDLPQVQQLLEDSKGVSWTLDVCLDYFACGNPFLSGVRSEVAAPFAAVLNAATFRRAGPVLDQVAFWAKSDAFNETYCRLLDAVVSNSDSAVADPGDMIGDTENCEVQLLSMLGNFLPNHRREALLSDLQQALDSAQQSELQSIRDAKDMVTLPLHAVTQESDVDRKLELFEAFITHLSSDECMGGRPSVVTIARSVVDGFCPMRWHCQLERGILDILQRCFNPLEVIYSDELDALEGAI